MYKYRIPSTLLSTLSQSSPPGFRVWGGYRPRGSAGYAVDRAVVLEVDSEVEQAIVQAVIPKVVSEVDPQAGQEGRLGGGTGGSAGCRYAVEISCLQPVGLESCCAVSNTQNQGE